MFFVFACLSHLGLLRHRNTKESAKKILEDVFRESRANFSAKSAERVVRSRNAGKELRALALSAVEWDDGLKNKEDIDKEKILLRHEKGRAQNIAKLLESNSSFMKGAFWLQVIPYAKGKRKSSGRRRKSRKAKARIRKGFIGRL